MFECRTRVLCHFQISDTANPTDDYLVVCDNEVKNKWKQKKYCSSNITIQYHQKQKNYLGYHSTVEYRGKIHLIGMIQW